MRVCDNDNCEWESVTDDDGVVRIKWNHVPECDPQSSTVDDEWNAYLYV